MPQACCQLEDHVSKLPTFAFRGKRGGGGGRRGEGEGGWEKGRGREGEGEGEREKGGGRRGEGIFQYLCPYTAICIGVHCGFYPT